MRSILLGYSQRFPGVYVMKANLHCISRIIARKKVFAMFVSVSESAVVYNKREF